MEVYFDATIKSPDFYFKKFHNHDRQMLTRAINILYSEVLHSAGSWHKEAFEDIEEVVILVEN